MELFSQNGFMQKRLIDVKIHSNHETFVSLNLSTWIKYICSQTFSVETMNGVTEHLQSQILVTNEKCSEKLEAIL